MKEFLPVIIVSLSLILLFGGVIYFLEFKNKNIISIHGKIVVYTSLSFMLLIVITFSMLKILGAIDLYQNIAVTIIICWIIILLSYYAWALYYYNVNFGWSEDDWTRHRRHKEVNPDLLEEEPSENPNHEHTLGLPPGTVRGTVALTLLVGGMSVTIAALSMENRLAENELLIDNFDFFKQAFLMMIAFYFGTKSLEILEGKKKGEEKGSPDEGSKVKKETVNKRAVAIERAGKSNPAVTKAKKLLQEAGPEKPMQHDFNDPNAQG